MKHDAKIERLASIPALAGCSHEELTTISAIADEVDVEPGRTIITQGKTLRHAYIVVEGAADVSVDGQHVGSVDAGEIFGEVSMFDPAPAVATVTASAPTHLIVIEHARFIATVRHNPDLAIALLKTMARHFHNTQAAQHAATAARDAVSGNGSHPE